MTDKVVQRVTILLYSSNLDITPLQKSLLDHCSDNNLTIAKIIIAKEPYDYLAFCELIQIIRKENNSSINLIIDKTSLQDLSYLLIWLVIGVLQEVKLIDKLYIYDGKERILIENLLPLLNICTTYFKYLMLVTPVTMTNCDEEL
ncbi:hypothetical protein [Candidatus Tisiphia endosymbiont of Beris chalybata]|uniref:hypothetical protein n=1 Tax=Candidatus Tisiphia endosymbiont of Beris chalybata TaxID=3066262 RepID=UPI00312C9633